MLSLKNISHSYPHFTLENISADIPAGSRVALLGLNGSGKSTLLHCIAKQQHEASILPQRLDFPLSCTALELVLFSLSEDKKWFQFDKPHDVEKAEHYLELTHAADFSIRQLSELSGGELQRVALAALLAREKNILLLDEPFTFLDIREQKNMLQLFEKLQHHNPQLTLMMSSHQLELMQHWCTHAMILKKGKLASFVSQEQFTEKSLLQIFEQFA